MKKFLKIAVFAIIIIVGSIIAVSVTSDSVVTSTMQDIENQVAADAVKQFEIAKKNGSTMDAYSAASMVKAAYLQANDEENYQKWHDIEQDLAKQLGL